MAFVVVLGTLFVGWVVWAALGAVAPGPRADVTAFRVVSDDEVEVRVTAVGDPQRRFSCSVQALGRTREVVGVAAVDLRPGRDGGQRWVSVRTRERAVTATIGRCAQPS